MTFISLAQKMLDGPGATTGGRAGKRTRRSSGDAAKLQKEVRAARRRKVPVTEIAERYGVTTSYIYQIGK
jgi:hypothetical protein